MMGTRMTHSVDDMPAPKSRRLDSSEPISTPSALMFMTAFKAATVPHELLMTCDVSSSRPWNPDLSYPRIGQVKSPTLGLGESDNAKHQREEGGLYLPGYRTKRRNPGHPPRRQPVPPPGRQRT